MKKIGQALRILFSIAPALGVLMVILNLLSAAQPFVNILFSQRIIDAYLGGATWEELILFALWAVGLNAGIVLLKALLHKRQEIEETRFKLRFEEKLRLHQMNYTLGDIMSNRVQEAQRGIEQAKMRGFQFETLIPRTQKLMQSVFSLSIAPLFPHGYGHARRFACDAFGRNEDVEYTLNAETYSWWQNGRLYSFNDPDHICLLRSFEMERDSSLGEARARYTASVISGTVMMLSDDYERPEARERAMQLATNREVNEVARSGVAFCPVSSNGGFACDTYTAVINGKHYLAVFHWEDTKEVKAVDLSRAQLTPGTVWKELWSGKTMQDEQGILKWDVEGCDTILLEEVTENTQQNS